MRSAKLSPQRLAEILDVAQEEFAQHGFDNASLNRILAQAGLSKGVAYYYFEDKAALFEAVFLRFFEQFKSRVGPVPELRDRAEFWRFVAHLYEQGMQLYSEDKRLSGMSRALSHLSRSTREGRIGKLRVATQSWVTQIVDRGQRVGAVRSDLPPELLHEVVLSLSEGIDRWWSNHADSYHRDDIPQFAEQVVDLYQRALAAPKEESREN